VALRPPSHHCRRANAIEVALGRTAAACTHPLAAWRTSRRSLRGMLVAGYFLLGFTTALAALLLF
jgi:hypothetical protein